MRWREGHSAMPFSVFADQQIEWDDTHCFGPDMLELKSLADSTGEIAGV